MFKTELHCHSSEVSNCATANAQFIVEKYLEAGYSTIVLTNHFSKYTFKNKRFDHSEDPWDKKVDYFINGYNVMKEAADGRLNIILGMELRYYSDPNDYLVYGVTEEFLRAHPEMMDSKTKEFAPIIKENGMILIQAHPFRNGMMITKPEYLDGIEVFNGHIGQESRNDIANLWADKFGFMKTSGTDFHHEFHHPDGGIMTEKPITNTAELVETLKSGNYELIRTDAVPY